MKDQRKATGWLNFGSGLYRRTHFFEQGAALCNSSLRWGDGHGDGDALPPGNACGTCLVKWSGRFDA